MRNLKRPVLAFASVCVLLGASAPAWAQAFGKISRNFYRIPYDDGISITMSRDYIDHGNTPAGNVGSMDVNTGANNPQIVAAADGTVIGVSDARNDCGCHSAYGPCANSVRIQHANGEYSTYLHIAQNSATNRGIVIGLAVTAGTPIGVEGDVGWTCGNDRAPQAGVCLANVPAGAGNCGRHLHWDVRRNNTNEYVNPMTCGISNNIYADNGNYTAGDCSTAGCVATRTLNATTYSGMGNFRVFQANTTITANDVTVDTQASLVLHCAGNVVLAPGFHADAGGHFRAEIGACNTTAVTPSP